MTFTIEEIRNYIQSQDSLGDVLYNLSEKNIVNANTPKEKVNYGDEWDTFEDDFDDEW